MELRLKGQEVTVRLSQNRSLLLAITAIESFSLSFNFRRIEKGYLGERAVRVDDIFDSVTGSLKFDHQDQDALRFIDFLKRRSQRLIAPADAIVNIQVRLAFPNGQVPKVNVPDVKFNAIPLDFGARDSYLSSTLDFGASDAKVLAV